MIYTYPDYYRQFKCIADKCEATCCAGWQIVVDEESLDKYRAVSDSHPFKKRLESSIDWDEEVFKQDKCRRCAFLNEKNLCDMFTVLGEESLCYTCTTYPRHIEEFENLREVSLSISCLEVARILLGRNEKVTFYAEETDEEDSFEDYEDFDELMFGILQDVRVVMLEILQDRTLDISTRCAIIWEMSEELQECLDEGSVFGCEDIIGKYVEYINAGKLLTATHIEDRLQKYMNNPKERYATALELFKKLYRLEVLDEEWERQVDETSLMIYGRDENYYVSMCREFDEWLAKNMPEWQVQCEQIAVYFLATYLCGAIYDGWVASKVKMSVVAVFYIHELLMAVWIKNEKSLTFEDIVNVTYRYSRELEHSDINLDEMEEAMNDFK